MISQEKNIFGFQSNECDGFSFHKTATFPNPIEDGDQISFSTILTDDEKDPTLPETPEQNIRRKLKGKVYTIKQRIPSARNGDSTSRSDPNSLASFGVAVKQLTKVHNSDDDKFFNRFKSAVPHQKIKLISEGNSQIMSSGERKSMLDETTDTQNQSSLNNSTNNSFQKETQNMFVIKTTSGSKTKVAKFNKIKAINPIPDIQSLTSLESTPTNRMYTPQHISSTSRGLISPSTDNQDFSPCSDSFRNPTFSSESLRKLTPVRINQNYQAPISTHHRVPSAQIKLTIPTPRCDTTPREKRTCDTLLPTTTERTGLNKIYENFEQRMKQVQSCPKEGTSFNFDLQMQEKTVRTKNNITIDNQAQLPSLDLRSLISPQYRQQILMPFSGNQITPLKFNTTTNTCKIDLSDNARAGLGKKNPKFKNQEVIINKIFDPQNHRKNLNA